MGAAATTSVRPFQSLTVLEGKENFLTLYFHNNHKTESYQPHTCDDSTQGISSWGHSGNVTITCQRCNHRRQFRIDELRAVQMVRDVLLFPVTLHLTWASMNWRRFGNILVCHCHLSFISRGRHYEQYDRGIRWRRWVPEDEQKRDQQLFRIAGWQVQWTVLHAPKSIRPKSNNLTQKSHTHTHTHTPTVSICNIDTWKGNECHIAVTQKFQGRYFHPVLLNISMVILLRTNTVTKNI